MGRLRFSRNRWRLSSALRDDVERLGMSKLRADAFELLGARLAPLHIANDGKQTPYRGHPVFVAQHATATCCRSCLLRVHNLPKYCRLSDAQLQFCVDRIMHWIAAERKRPKPKARSGGYRKIVAQKARKSSDSGATPHTAPRTKLKSRSTTTLRGTRTLLDYFARIETKEP